MLSCGYNREAGVDILNNTVQKSMDVIRFGAPHSGDSNYTVAPFDID